jgi:transcriptional regulator with XRE-family HTH domain
MGLTRRPTPSRLAEKLLQIRTALGLSQNEMLRQLGLAESSFRSTVSGYERGEREPPLPILLRYAEISNVYVDVLIDDRLSLPEKLPTSKKHTGVRTAKK